MDDYKNKVIKIGKYSLIPTNKNFYNPSYYVIKDGMSARMYAFTAESEDDYSVNTTMSCLKSYIDSFRTKFESARCVRKGA